MQCPRCKYNEKLQSRIKRKNILKIIPFSKAYKCYNCESEYLIFCRITIPYKIRRVIKNLKNTY